MADSYRRQGTDPIPWVVAVEKFARELRLGPALPDNRAELAEWTMAPLNSYAFKALQACQDALNREADEAWPDDMATVRMCRRLSAALRPGMAALLEETNRRQDRAFFDVPVGQKAEAA